MLSLFAAAALAAQSSTSCSPAISIRTTVAEIGENLNRFMDKCVTVAGPFAGLAMYGSVEDMYLTARYGPDGNYDWAAAKKGRLGLDSPRGELRGLKMDRIPRIEVTGIVDSCERRSAAARAREKANLARGEISIMMLTGYCHYYDGAVLNAVAWSFDQSTRYERMTGESARELFGNLVPLEDDWPFAQRLQAASSEFLAALRARDQAKLMALHDFTNPDHEFHRKVMDLLLRRSDSPFVQVRTNPNPQMQLFLDRFEVEQQGAGKDPRLALAVACYCRIGDCKGRWPISYNDADNWVTRPYACVRIRKEDWPGGKLIVETQPGSGRWLAEPERTAFHPH
jgi:hypothetical protein